MENIVFYNFTSDKIPDEQENVGKSPVAISAIKSM